MDGIKICVSEHACERLRERAGLNKKAVHKMAEKAYWCGVKHGETHGSLFKYISGLTKNSNKGTDIRLYGDIVYIFNISQKDNAGKEIILVTVFHLPNNLKKHVLTIQERKADIAIAVEKERI